MSMQEEVAKIYILKPIPFLTPNQPACLVFGTVPDEIVVKVTSTTSTYSVFKVIILHPVWLVVCCRPCYCGQCECNEMQCTQGVWVASQPKATQYIISFPIDLHGGPIKSNKTSVTVSLCHSVSIYYLNM